MKKAISFLCVLTMLVAFAVPVFAVSKDDVMAELNSGITIGSKTKQVPAEYINAAQKYLDTHTLTDAQLSSIVADVQAAKATAVASGKTEFDQMDAATQQAIISSVQKAADTAGLKVTVNSDKKSVAVTDAAGNVIYDNSGAAPAPATNNGTTTGGNSVIKTTGASVSTSALVVISVLFLTLIGTASAVAVKRKLIKE